MNDLQTLDDCRRLVRTFYRLGGEDSLLGPIFHQRLPADWEPHLERIARFWATILLGRSIYQGEPMRAHAGMSLTEAHFARWLSLWGQTVDQLFQGPIATRAKESAQRMSGPMQRFLREHEAPPPEGPKRIPLFTPSKP